jgi:hypothetical protein
MMGTIVMRLSPLGIKWESQIADAIANPITREVTVYNEQSRKYCVSGAADMERRANKFAELDKRADEKRGWKYGEWKKIGKDKVLGYSCKVFERLRTVPGIILTSEKVWLLDDPRMAEYQEMAGPTSALVSRTRFPESGMPLKRTSLSTDLRARARSKAAPQAQPTKAEPEGDLLELSGPSPDLAAKGAPKPSAQKAIKPNVQKPVIEYIVVSVTKEKTDPSRYKIPKNFTRVQNYTDVLEMGGLDGTLMWGGDRVGRL